MVLLLVSFETISRQPAARHPPAFLALLPETRGVEPRLMLAFARLVDWGFPIFEGIPHFARLEFGPQQTTIFFAWLVGNKGDPKKATKRTHSEGVWGKTPLLIRQAQLFTQGSPTSACLLTLPKKQERNHLPDTGDGFSGKGGINLVLNQWNSLIPTKRTHQMDTYSASRHFRKHNPCRTPEPRYAPCREKPGRTSNKSGFSGCWLPPPKK